MRIAAIVAILAAVLVDPYPVLASDSFSFDLADLNPEKLRNTGAASVAREGPRRATNTTRASAVAGNTRAADTGASNLADLSLEQLMNIQVTSVSRKEQRVRETAVAVHVITQEDIRRFGATSLAEALRLAPGVTVARLDANKWMISIRGFVDRYANKLLVLIDGRSVYTPLFSGVFWDVQDLLLEDVERIEVIRGPGATLWGANAVNGIINIITKSASETQGTLIAMAAGSEDREISGVRHGMALDEKTHARAYVKHFSRDGLVNESGEEAGDGWHALRGGFRVDHKGRRSTISLQGDVYGGAGGGRAIQPTLEPPSEPLVHEDIRFSGGNALGSWKWTPNRASEMALQLYLDHTLRSDAIHRELRNTFDLDFLHRFPWGSLGEIVWGAEGRFSFDDIAGRGDRKVEPPKRSDVLAGAFIQSETPVYHDRLHVLLGAKLEHKNSSGFALQPSARLLYQVSQQDVLWFAVSRAVRTPARTERDMAGSFAVQLDTAPWPTLATVRGNPDFDSESLMAYEAGYRLWRSERFFVDVALFYNDYRRLRTWEPGFIRIDPGPPEHAVLTYHPENLMRGYTLGGEVAANWRPMPRLQLSAGYAHLQRRFRLDPTSADPWTPGVTGDIPRHQGQLRAALDLPRHLTADAWLHYASAWPLGEVGAISRLDLRLGWRPSPKVEISAAVQNAIDDHYYEARKDLLAGRAQIERNMYVKATLAF